MSRVMGSGLKPDSNSLFMAIYRLDWIQMKTLGFCQKTSRWPAKIYDCGAYIMKNKAIFSAGTLSENITNKDMKAKRTECGCHQAFRLRC
jgi:hypothetical protein